jgi:RNA polymerase sigma-70 factor (ECF subfamily)
MNLQLENRLVSTFNDLRGSLASTLLHLVGNHADAQDALQAAFIKCWEARGELPSVSNLRAWVWRVAVNAGKDLGRSAWRRRRRSLSSLPEVPTCPQETPLQHAVQSEQGARLLAAIQRLRKAEREVFLLRQNGDLTYQEIAALRHKPVATVKTQMRAAVRKLRCTLHDADSPCTN